MIIMLNGAFGVGKTSLAEALRQRIDRAMIYDPEIIGTMARIITAGVREGGEDTDDFQDINLWPTFTVEIGLKLIQRYRRPLIVPMTLSNPTYLALIRDGFGRGGVVRHFCLVAPFDVIAERLAKRGDGPESWAWGKSAAIAATMMHPRYGEHLDATTASTAELAELVCARLAEEPALR